jgi:phosphohistidine phosphatase
VATLLLVRHSKAAIGDDDSERPLTPRGFRDAEAIGRWLARLGLAPDLVVVSPARRAVQTWEQAAAVLAATRPSVADPPIVDPRIYDNTAQALLAVLLDVPPQTQVVALVGHNPSMERLARLLDDGAGDAAAMDSLADGYPTSGVAVFMVAGTIAGISPGSATLSHFQAPRG